MPDTEQIGTEEYPYDPEDVVQTAVIEAHEHEPPPKPDTTLDMVLDAVIELTKQCGEMAANVKGMKESHDKWVKAGKF
jgi:hypothetical protein